MDMGKDKLPITPGIRFLRAAKVSYTDHLYKYEERGGTTVSARELKVDEHSVVKTLVMEDEQKRPVIVLMHGDCQVSTKELARQIGVKAITPCTPETAEKHTGYKLGGTSPFGTRRMLPIYLEAGILDLPTIYINAGQRGYLVGLNPRDILPLLNPVLVKVSISG
jgi:Cys-tRNA(Pro) deacylase